MNITKNQIDNLNATIKIEIFKADYANSLESVLKNYQKKAVVDGFRQGKVPMGIVRKMYGKSVLVDEINKLIGEALSNYIKENNLNIMGEPLPNETEQKELNLDAEDFEFVYDIALSPEINVKMSKREKVPFYLIDVTDKMVDEQIDAILESNGTMENVDTIEGDEYLNGELIELDENNQKKEGGVVNEDASMSLAYMKDEASKELFKNKKVAEEVIFDAVKSFPNKVDFASMLGVSKERAENVNANFCFIIKEIKRHKKGEINEELFTKLYGADVVKSEEEFRAKVKSDLELQLRSHSEYRFTIDAKDKLIKKNEEVVLPEAFLKRWIVAVNEGLTSEQVEKDFEGYRDEFKWQLIKNAIVREAGIKVDAEDMKADARKIAAAQLQQYGLFGLSDEQLDGFAAKLLEDEKQRQHLYERTMENKIYNYIKDSVKVEEETISFEDFEKLFKA